MAKKPFSNLRTPYEECIVRLNGLQSNTATIQKLLSKRDWMHHVNVAETKWCLEKCNIKLDDIDKLNVIHITGTKGKGSTCAFTESILRQLGFKTGFFNSPHLIHVRERIRINGKPLSEEEFTKYFQCIYNKLKDAVKESNGASSMPGYFKFLTIVAFYVFIEEKVDVAIMEVGIGGEHDCTNVIRNPVVCAVTKLDYDHMALLGSTIESIAWNKAGIFKNGSTAVVLEQDNAAAMKVLRERAVEKHCLLRIAPPYNAYNWPEHFVELGIPGIHQQQNVALAFQVTKLWLDKVGKSVNMFKQDEGVLSSDSEILPAFTVPQTFVDGISLCRWPGRTQVIRRESTTYYLDGAHTPESMKCCIKWFLAEEQKANILRKQKPFQVLLFHCKPDKNPATILGDLKKCNFKLAIFCPTQFESLTDAGSDRTNYQYLFQEQLAKAAHHAKIWHSFSGCEDSVAEEFDCIWKAIKRIEQVQMSLNSELVVLVTGLRYTKRKSFDYVDDETDWDLGDEKKDFVNFTKFVP